MAQADAPSCVYPLLPRMEQGRGNLCTNTEFRTLSASLQTFPNVYYNFSRQKNASCMDLGTRNSFYLTRQ